MCTLLGLVLKDIATKNNTCFLKSIKKDSEHSESFFMLYMSRPEIAIHKK
jgi:hypothetical protein